MEKAILNIDVLNISQGANAGFSHKGDEAIDIVGVNNFKAPFTGTIKKIVPNDNEVWLESNDKVQYADGTVDYMTVLTMHDNDISNLYVGKVIRQGEIYYNQGHKGNATGDHIHLTVGKGKFTGSGWFKNSYGYWCINNQYNITRALFLYNDVKIISSPYSWKRAIYSAKIVEGKTIEELAYEVIKGIWGNNPERKRRLQESGYDYYAVQSMVNELLSPKPVNSYYVVEKGDYLIKIGQKLNKDWRKIASDNNLKFPYTIYPGQTLIIR